MTKVLIRQSNALRGPGKARGAMAFAVIRPELVEGWFFLLYQDKRQNKQHTKQNATTFALTKESEALRKL